MAPLDSLASLLSQTSSLPQNSTNDHPARIRMGSLGILSSSRPSKTSPSRRGIPLYSFQELREWIHEERYDRTSVNQPGALKRVHEGYVGPENRATKTKKNQEKKQNDNFPKFVKETCEVIELPDGRRRQVFHHRSKLVTTMGDIDAENRYTINKPRPEDSLNFMKRAPVAGRIRSQNRRVLYEHAFDIAKEANVSPTQICLST